MHKRAVALPRAVPLLRRGARAHRGLPVPGAEYDHAFHRGINRPEHGRLVCEGCHDALTHGGYLMRFPRLPEFRAFQGAVLRQRPQPRRSRPLQAG